MIDGKLKAAHPTEPWLWNAGWKEKRVVHSHLRDGAGLLAFAAAWNIFMWSIALFVLDGDEPAIGRWVVWAFAFLGLFLRGEESGRR